MKVLFIGGTGIISSACSELAIDKGIDLYHLNRGKSMKTRPVRGVKNITADIRDEHGTQKAIESHSFDVVVNWVAFVREHVEADIRLFAEKTKQYIFISSASVYETPPSRLPVTEDTPLHNPVWQYSRDKIACEELLREEHARSGFPYTIVRPSHTYDKTLIPMEGGFTVLDRMLRGKPVVVHGDGSSIWTLTHHRDFAKGLVGLLGNTKAIGESFHITSNELLTWDMIYKEMAKALGVDITIKHIPSEVIAKYNKQIGESLLGDKTHSMIFDNTKIKEAVPGFSCDIPFSRGAREITDWYVSHAAACIVDKDLDQVFDEIIEKACL